MSIVLMISRNFLSLFLSAFLGLTRQSTCHKSYQLKLMSDLQTSRSISSSRHNYSHHSISCSKMLCLANALSNISIIRCWHVIQHMRHKVMLIVAHLSKDIRRKNNAFVICITFECIPV